MGLVHRTHRSPSFFSSLLGGSALGRVILLGVAGMAAAVVFGLPSCGDDGPQEGGAEADPRVDGAAGAPTKGGSDLDLSFPAVDRTSGGRAARDPVKHQLVRSAADRDKDQDAKRARRADTAAAPEPKSSPRVAGAEALRSQLEGIVANALREGGKASKGKVTGRNTVVAIMAVDVETGSVLVRRQAEMPLIPASNLKLLTCAAALAGLGPDGEFRTPFEAVGEIRGGVLTGDLIVRAGGDPLYQREGDGGVDAWVQPLAADLKRAGISEVTGALILDEGSWLEPGPGPQWPASSDYWMGYCALAGGFTVNAGCFRATVTPQPKRGRADVVLQPEHHGLRRRGKVTLGKRNAVNVGANKAGVTVKGTIPSSSPVFVSEFSAPDPVELFGHVIVGELADAGVTIAGGFVRSRNVAARGPVVHEMRSPIRAVLAPILEDSHNSLADQLFLALGAQTKGAGTRSAAGDAVRAALDKIGVPSDGLVQVDGSGLSKENRTNAIQLVALVAAVMKTGGATADAFIRSLPVSGKSGSLAKRMRRTPAEGRVRAKTGWVAGASSLSGVATTTTGRTVVFSILVSYPRVGGLNPKVWKPMQDKICEALVGWDPRNS